MQVSHEFKDRGSRYKRKSVTHVGGTFTFFVKTLLANILLACRGVVRSGGTIRLEFWIVGLF